MIHEKYSPKTPEAECQYCAQFWPWSVLSNNDEARTSMASQTQRPIVIEKSHEIDQNTGIKFF
jgi:hypothetical protein